jgi:hypothetical protein
MGCNWNDTTAAVGCSLVPDPNAVVVTPQVTWQLRNNMNGLPVNIWYP